MSSPSEAGPLDGLYMSMSMDQLKKVADDEAAHSPRLQEIVSLWDAISNQVLLPAITGLDTGVQKVQATWQDNTYPAAFEAPAMEARKSLQSSMDIIKTADIPGEIAELQTAIGRIKTAVDGIYQEYQTANRPIAVASEWGSTVLPPDPQELEKIRLRAVDEIVKLHQAFSIAGAQIAMAGQGHRWNGPRAAGAPTPGSPSSPSSPSPQSQPTSPGGPSEQPGGQQPGGEQPGGQQPGGQQPGGEQPGGQQPGGQPPGDTGLAGGGPAAPPTMPNTPTPTPPTPNPTPTPTPPPGPIPGPTPPGGGIPPGGRVPVGGGVPVGGAGGPLAAGGAAARGVEQAARNLSVPKTAGSGSAPSLPASTTGTSSTQTPTAMGGVPPMMPPMAPHGGAGNSGRPKPGTAQPVGPGRSRPAGPNAGVPAGLRGRTGQGDAGRPAPESRRARRDGPQSVEILDSELWQVDEPSPAAAPDRRTARQPGPSGASG